MFFTLQVAPSVTTQAHSASSQLDPVVELANTIAAYRQTIGGIGIEPTAAVIECRRQVPVVERHHGAMPWLSKRIREAVVEGEPGRIDRARALRITRLQRC